MSKDYNLNFEGLSTQAYFFDFDLDNDLDLFLLNHSVYPNRNYSNGEQRQSYDPLAGDRFYENQGGSYVDISSKVKLFQKEFLVMDYLPQFQILMEMAIPISTWETTSSKTITST